MIFIPEHARLVLHGQKTKTRRLQKQGDYYDRGARAVYNIGNRRGDSGVRQRRWQVGRWYAIQDGRGRRSLGDFELQSLRGERLQDITEGEAREEGYGSRLDFADAWDRIYPSAKWATNPKVWVLGMKRWPKHGP